jgi:site-specific DNA-methyltransferase (adenine-specific)
MGNFDLRLGDCLHPTKGLASLPDKSVDVTITDPPYESDAHSKGRRIHNPRTHVLKMAPLSFAAITPRQRAAVAGHLARVSRRWILVFCQIEGVTPWIEVLRDAGARYVRTMVWVKPNGQPQLTGDRPGVGYECIVVCHGTVGRRMHWNGGGKRGWMEFPVDANFSREKRLHETQKPLPLMSSLVADFSDHGETILDPFAGSGTTGVAALRQGRRFVGWERDRKPHAAAVRRLKGTREQLALFRPKVSKPKQESLL